MPDSNGPWRVIAEPQGKNPGFTDKLKGAVGATPENMGGMVIFLANGRTKEEVSRVGWVRRATKNPKVSFEKQLAKEVTKAQESAKLLNAYAATAGDLQ